MNQSGAMPRGFASQNAYQWPSAALFRLLLRLSPEIGIIISPIVIQFDLYEISRRPSVLRSRNQ
ncbi:MAG: hypothetical protein AAFN10_00740 [Bacteroidota bacterium]